MGIIKKIIYVILITFMSFLLLAGAVFGVGYIVDKDFRTEVQNLIHSSSDTEPEKDNVVENQNQAEEDIGSILDKVNEEYSIRIDQLNKEKEEIENDLLFCQNNLENVLIEKEQLEIEISELNAEINDLNFDNIELINKRTELENQLINKDNQIQNLQSEIDRLNYVIERLELSLINLNEIYIWESAQSDIYYTFAAIPGCYIWSDSLGNIYCSNNTRQVYLDKDNYQWITKEWVGFVPVNGECVWNFDGDTYYSDNDLQYKLNNETGIWEAVIWNGLSSFSADELWFTNNYVYRKKTHRYNKDINYWEEVDVHGANTFAQCTWSDGVNTYLMIANDLNFVFDEDNLEWLECVEHNIEFTATGRNIFYFQNDIFLLAGSSEGRVYLKFNKETNIFEKFNIYGHDPLMANNIWSDGENLFYTESGSPYLYKLNVYKVSDLIS